MPIYSSKLRGQLPREHMFSRCWRGFMHLNSVTWFPAANISPVPDFWGLDWLAILSVVPLVKAPCTVSFTKVVV